MKTHASTFIVPALIVGSIVAAGLAGLIKPEMVLRVPKVGFILYHIVAGAPIPVRALVLRATTVAS